ncbi:MAG: hypothetical protein ACFCU4_11400 [Puniceicoccaceae bacterium]
MPSPISDLSSSAAQPRQLTTYTPESALSDPRRLVQEMVAELRNSCELAVSGAAFLLLLLGWTIFHITVPRIIERMGM